MKYSGAELTIKLLEKQGIEFIAGIPGGANLPLYNALYESPIRHILARHEQGAGFIAHGMARSTGKTAVCFATSGPGVTNTITAVADAKLDSVPIVFITGQVSLSLIGTDAFQEVDTYGLTLPITKHNFLVHSARELLEVIPEAFRIALSGRPGPVVVDIPKDVQMEMIEINELPEPSINPADSRVSVSDAARIARIINEAKRPLMLIGGGVINSNAQELLLKLIKKNTIPAASTLMGLGCIPQDDALSLGMLGMHGARYTNYIVNEADLVLAFGVRFDDRATGKIKGFCPDATIVHIDIDESEIDKVKKTNISVTGDIGQVVCEMLPYINRDSRSEWMDYIKGMKLEYPVELPEDKSPYHPCSFIRKVGEMLDENTIITTDVGQHQMWVAQAYPFRKPRTLLTSGGLGTMGIGLPAAIGAALAHPDKRIVCFTGDGSILMNIQELATLADLNLNVTVLIMNNKHLGLVRQQQELFYEKHYIATKFIANPNFARIAGGFGIISYDLEDTEDPMGILKKAFSEPGPCVINVPIDPEEQVTPMVPPGAANNEMIGGCYDDTDI
ncbi:MAG: acetolactate synthase catalytic subunit [Clostridia bacterium BRH_c25]|nr:MAG: acetolactate synthase catalytic subunit [Clostridia bacterium BRH_c25]